MVIQTYDGTLVDLTHINPSDITLHHIAKTLSALPRFNGITETHYSVAQHSLFVSMLMGPSPEAQLAGLLHDGAEAYTGDFLGPIKAHITELQQLDWKVQWAVYEHFDLRLTEALQQEIHIFDMQMLATEKAQLLNHPDLEWPLPLPTPLSFEIIPMQARDAQTRFIKRVTDLQDAIRSRKEPIRF